MKNPIISIIVPCYNQAQYLDECLESILYQTYSSWECIIVNDGSPDNTDTLAQEWLIKDSRFKYIYQENGGLSSARNTGIKTAKGKYILPLDADDKIAKDYILLALQQFDKNKQIKIVYSKAEKFGMQIGEWKLPDFSLINLSRSNLIFCSAVFLKQDWESVKGYDVNMKYGWEDWDFWIAVLKNGGQVFKLNTVGFYYRVKNDSMISNFDIDKKKEMYDYLSVKHADFFIRYYGSFFDQHEKLIQNNAMHNSRLKNRWFLFKSFFRTFFSR
jgi:glycosyltransferase involved in cell wall biosynthesis